MHPGLNRGAGPQPTLRKANVREPDAFQGLSMFWRPGIVVLPALIILPFCHGAESPTEPASTNSVVVPFEYRRGHIMVRPRVNDSEPLLFMVDSGFAINMISPEQAEALQLRRTGKITIVGVAGEESADLCEGVVFDFGNGFTYRSRRIAALPSHSRRFVRRDGVLGAGFYRQFTIEVDHPSKKLTLHRPETFTYGGTGEIVPLKFRKSTPFISASILIPGQAPIAGEFEIDTGCDGGLCLGHDFVESSGLEEKLSPGKRSARSGVGGDKKTHSVRLPQVQIGKLLVDRPSADLFEDGSPAERGFAGHIGMEVLRQFHLIFDYSRNRLIFERPGAPSESR
jgi:predicted aspartyl protease